MSGPLEILLPNGQVLAVQMYIDSAGGPIKWDGKTVTVTALASEATQLANKDLLTNLLNADLTPDNATVITYSNSLVIKNTPGRLFSLHGYNSKNADQFIQLHNAVALPANGAIPVITMVALSRSNFSLDLGRFGRFFSAGIVVCNSTTSPAKTLGATDCWFDAQFK
jgi:hypothetical protein